MSSMKLQKMGWNFERKLLHGDDERLSASSGSKSSAPPLTQLAQPQKGVLIPCTIDLDTKTLREEVKKGYSPCTATIIDLTLMVEELATENEMILAALTDFRYSHSEIEITCGGELALMVREKVLARRDKILTAIAVADVSADPPQGA